MIEEFQGLEDWFSYQWFTLSSLLNYNWANGFVLTAIPLVPVIYLLRWLFHFNFRQKIDVAFSAEIIRKRSFVGWLRFIPNIFYMLFVSMLIVSLARPQKSSEKIESHKQGINIVIALDISESMLLEDFQPNRLQAAKKILTDFIEKRGSDKIGVVVFSGAAYTLAPLTTDHALLKQSIEEIDPSVIDTGATAIGNAIAVAINRFNETYAFSKVLILITDGENTEGNIGPEMAAKLAYANDIKIYTIGIGKNGLIPYGKDENGKVLSVQSSINEVTLKKIASIGKGIYMRATDIDVLESIFKKIDQLEKGEIKENRFNDNKDYYQIYLLWSLIFFIIWMFTKSTFLTNALED